MHQTRVRQYYGGFSAVRKGQKMDKQSKCLAKILRTATKLNYVSLLTEAWAAGAPVDAGGGGQATVLPPLCHASCLGTFQQILIQLSFIFCVTVILCNVGINK